MTTSTPAEEPHPYWTALASALQGKTIVGLRHDPDPGSTFDLIFEDGTELQLTAEVARDVDESVDVSVWARVEQGSAPQPRDDDPLGFRAEVAETAELVQAWEAATNPAEKQRLWEALEPRVRVIRGEEYVDEDEGD